ncbi:class I SAM-dependent methyltransferase [Candidatus Poriferisodalis sp.]|uniref:class I SAM-dependent methyltransferase n=1 Tax=Candidatus Poriferisodalis sp. TaxID=3101277 RepID=UPI003B022271
MSQSDDPNAEQREFWRAAAVWVDQQERLDAQLAHIGVAAMDAVDGLPSAARVLDVGCGCGQTSLQWSERVSGSVLGVDISEPLVEVARRRAAEHSAAYPEAAPISFAVADAQTADIAGLATESAADNGSFAGFDVVFSRLGVMFFADPAAAFANLRSATRPGGQLSFVCWQRARNNPWLVSVNKAVLGIVEMPSSDGPAVDPFAFADPDHVQGILDAAGWSDIAIEPHDTELLFSGGGTLEETVDFAMDLGIARRALAGHPPEVHAQVRDAVTAVLAPRQTPAGVVFPAATWIATARN